MAQAAERPILKRRRTDSVSPPRDTYIRDERFWYPDGNIIIVAQGVAFRVFKSILAEDSEVFRDMFQLPTPASNPSQSAAFLNPAEDCPVVHVTDTDAEFRSLLDVLLRGKQYIRRRAFSFEDVANCVRLAHKYGIEETLEDSMGELTKWFPVEFRHWPDAAPGFDSELDPIVAVNLARLTDNAPLLTIALYFCCQLEVKDLLQGRIRRDNIVDKISDDDFACCMRGKAILCTRKVQMIQNVFAPIDNLACTSREHLCNVSLGEIMAEQIRCVEDGAANVLDSWDDIIRSHRRGRKSKPTSPLCSSCAAIVIERESTIRAHLWLDLPDLLELD